MEIEFEMALVTFAAVVAAQLGKAGLRILQSFVKGTKTNLDDKILAAVQGAFAKEAKKIPPLLDIARHMPPREDKPVSRDTDQGMTK